VTQGGGAVALLAPFNSLISIGGSSPTFNLVVSQTQAVGYPDVTVRVSCTNSAQTITHEVTIRQKINCAAALTSNTTSLLKDYEDSVGDHYAAIPYTASPEFKDLTQYATAASMFTQVAQHITDCGALTVCATKPVGCSGTYTGGRV